MEKYDHLTKGMVVDIDQCLLDGVSDLIEASGLSKIPSWKDYQGTIPRNALARYIVYIYSIDSFLNKANLPLKERKFKAMELAGLDPNDNQVMDWVYWLKAPEILDMVHDYLRWHTMSEYWTEYVATEMQIDEANKILLTPIDITNKKGLSHKDKSELRKDVMEMIKDKEVLSKKVYGEFNDAKVEMRKRMITLESRAKPLLDNVEAD